METKDVLIDAALVGVAGVGASRWAACRCTWSLGAASG